MSKFNIGDTVRCIFEGDIATLQEGELYTVSVIRNNRDGNFIGVDGQSEANYLESRFELVTEAAPKNVMIDVEALIGLLNFVDWSKRDIINYLSGYLDGAEEAAL